MPRSAATCRGRRPHAAVGGQVAAVGGLEPRSAASWLPRSAASLPRSAASSRGLRPRCRGLRPRCCGRRPGYNSLQRGRRPRLEAADRGNVAADRGSRPPTAATNVAADRGSRPPTAAASGRRPRLSPRLPRRLVLLGHRTCETLAVCVATEPEGQLGGSSISPRLLKGCELENSWGIRTSAQLVDTEK